MAAPDRIAALARSRRARGPPSATLPAHAEGMMLEPVEAAATTLPSRVS